jgi:glycogen(starch) synthase
MRVLFWSEQFWPQIGGIEVWGARLLVALQRRKYQFVVVAGDESGALGAQDNYQGTPVYRFPFWSTLARSDLRSLIDMKASISSMNRGFAPDLVHLNLTGPSVYFHLQAAGNDRTPLLISLHQPLVNQSATQDSIVSRILRAADWVTAASDMVYQSAREIVPEIATRSSVIEFGFNVDGIDPEPLPFAPPRLLCYGRHVFEKGFDLVLTAFSALVDRFPELRLVIASDGPARSDLERQATELGIAARVDFIGWVDSDQIPALLNSATIVLVPSRVVEGFGLVAMEAATMGRPVIATRSGGLPEVVIHGETGLIVERDDSDALARSVACLLGNRQAAEAMGRAARARAETRFGWERHVDAFEALYQRLAGAAASK